MGIQDSIFGGNSNTSRGRGSQRRGNNHRDDQELVDAKFWLNIGYLAKLENPETGQVETRFISLFKGVALDSMEAQPSNSSNEMWAMQQHLRNQLLATLMAAAEKLAPGEEKIFGDPSGLQVQLRRVREEEAEADRKIVVHSGFQLKALEIVD